MATKIFVNLPVKDLNKSVAFFNQLGYTFNPQFTNEKATCMIISDDIYVMLLVEEFFQSFIPTKIADTGTTTESIICLSAENKQQVDEMINKAVAAGATTYRDPQDHGFMYGHSYRDLDGHLWEMVWMDENAVPQAEQAEGSAVV